MRDRAIAIPVVVVLVIILLFSLPAMGMLSGSVMVGWDDVNPWWGVLMALFWVLIVAGLALLVLALVRRGQEQDHAQPAGSSRALEILRERYARGEISREEFEQMRRHLES